MTAERKILDERMLEQLYREHFSGLSLYALRYVGDADTAREIVQNVFIALWERRGQVDVSRPLRSFLYTSVRNRCLNHLRDTVRFEELESAGEKPHPEEEDGESLHRETLQSRLYEAIAGLPERSRQIFEMNRFEGLTYRQIAERLDISPKTVETLMSRTLRTLREQLRDLLALLTGMFMILKQFL